MKNIKKTFFKSVKTGRQFKALIQINQSEFRCKICEITICSKSELQPHFVHPRHERYEQYYKEVDSVSSWSQIILQSESKSDDNLDLRCLLSKEVKSVKTGRQFKALIRINQSEFRCMICEITICNKSELKSHFIHPRHERYDQYYKEVDTDSSWSQNDPRNWKARKRSRKYSNKHVLTHEKQPHRNGFKSALEIRHAFEEKMSDLGLPSSFGESRYVKRKRMFWKKKPKRKPKSLPENYHNYETYPNFFSKDCQYGTEHQLRGDQGCDRDSREDQYCDRDLIEDQYYDRDSIEDQYCDRDPKEDQYYDRDSIEDQNYDRESREDQCYNRDPNEEKENNQNTTPDDDYSDYVPVQYCDRDSIEDQYYDIDSREDQCHDRESSEEKENNQNTPPDDDYSDYVPVTELPESSDNNDVENIEMPQENFEKNGKKSALPEKSVTLDFMKDSNYYGNRPKGKFRPVIIDGCNVGHTYGQNKYNRRNYSAMGLWIAYQYFKNLGYENEDVIIVQRHISPRNLTNEDREIMEELKDLGILKDDYGFGYIGKDLVRPDDDLFILKLASKLEGIGKQN